MTSISVNIDGLENLAKDFEQSNVDVQKELREAIVLTAYEVHSKAVDSIARGSKTGYEYDWRGVTGNIKPDSFRKVGGRIIPVKLRAKPHRASAKGEAPATDTGKLINSLQVLEKTGLRAEVWANANYSGYLESTTGLNRPFLQPAVDKSIEFLEKKIAEAIGRAML